MFVICYYICIFIIWSIYIQVIESFYNMQGGDKSYVDAKGTFTDFSQGGLKPTGNTLDIALDGKGFFEVATPSGKLEFSQRIQAT